MASDDPSAVAIQAAINGNLRLLKKMARKVDLREAKDSSGGNLLHFAAARGHLEICRFLVEESGLGVNSATPHDETPVAAAAMGGKMRTLRYLLDHGGDPGMPDAVGDTPLHEAAYQGQGHDQALKVLLEHGADPNRVAHNIYAPLIKACIAGSLKCIKLLVEAGADVNFRSPYGPSLLMKAVIDGSTDIVKFLLEAGADPDISDEFGEIPIMQAARDGRRDLVEILFPHTKPITSLPNWSVDGIITAHMPFKFKDAGLTKEHILAHVKPQGNEAFAKGDYVAAAHLYGVAMQMDPLDATLFSNRSLCWLRLGDGKRALSDAQQCKMIQPCWSKAWYHEGAALSLLKNYRGAANAFVEARKLDPACDEIKTALREAIEALRFAARSEEQNP